jgi:hypothetical protein
VCPFPQRIRKHQACCHRGLTLAIFRPARHSCRPATIRLFTFGAPQAPCQRNRLPAPYAVFPSAAQPPRICLSLLPRCHTRVHLRSSPQPHQFAEPPPPVGLPACRARRAITLPFSASNRRYRVALLIGSSSASIPQRRYITLIRVYLYFPWVISQV